MNSDLELRLVQLDEFKADIAAKDRIIEQYTIQMKSKVLYGA